MNTFDLSVQTKNNVSEISKKVYKQGETEYTIYNYYGSVKTDDFSACVHNEETFLDQLHEKMNEDERFDQWVQIEASTMSIRKTQNIQSLGVPMSIKRETCEPRCLKLCRFCKENNISFNELLTLYNKDATFHQYNNCRSVITCNDNIVTVAPPKSIPFETFKNENNKVSYDFTKHLYANEVIEGTMINLFYNKSTDCWEIATKSAVGGNYWFYRTQYDGSLEFDKQMTFREMFLEALDEKDQELSNTNFVSNLSVDLTYSFVMQHPANHIVLNIKNPSIYLVAGFKIDGDVVTNYTPEDAIKYASDDYSKRDNVHTDREVNFYMSSVLNIIKVPRVVDITGKSVDEIVNISQDYDAGIMVHSKINRKRVKVVNVTYERLKDVRGNNPNLHYHYLSLFAAGKVDEFLLEFPVYKRLFYQFYRQSYEFIKEIHDAYVSYYVKKMGKSVRINKSVFTHIYTLHNTYYIPTIDSEMPTIVTRDVVSKYYNAMTPKEKLYHVSYKTREYTNKQKDIGSSSKESNIISASY